MPADPTDRLALARQILATAQASAGSTAGGIAQPTDPPPAPSARDPASPRPARSAADPAARAHAACVDLLSTRPRTRAELDQVLTRRGLDAQHVQAVLDRLERAGLVDDAAYARSWVEQRHQLKGLSRMVLAAELRRKGVAAPAIAAALAQVEDADEVEAAARLAAAKARRLPAGLSPLAAHRRIAGYLTRRGYPAGLASRLASEALGARAARS